MKFSLGAYSRKLTKAGHWCY